MNKFIGFLFLCYGSLLAAGGLMGYFKANSKISLVMGLASGLLVIICSLGIFKKIVYFFYLAFASTILIDLMFFFRYWRTDAFFPGLMSIVTSCVLLTAYYSARKQPQNTK